MSTEATSTGTALETSSPTRARSVSGPVSLTAILVSVALIVVVGAAGPSAAVPVLDHPGWPPVFRLSPASNIFVTATLWSAVTTGTAGVAGGLLAVRSGWRPSPRRLAVAVVLCVVALVFIPPMGSSDMTDYATYGRMAVLGHNPQTMTPRELRATGDPVARLSSYAWLDSPTVYGPVSTASEWAASALGGTSTARTTFWLKVWDGLAFLATALALDRLAGPRRDRRVRVHLLWSLNPLMLFAGLAGGHADILGAALMVVSLTALRRSPLAAGLVMGGAAAVKATFAVAGVGLAWALRGSPRRLLVAAAGGLAILVCGYLILGSRTATNLMNRSHVIGPDNPWDPITMSLGQPPSWMWSWGALVAALLLAALLAWRLPPGHSASPAVRATLAFSLAWLVTTPIYHQWYDILVFPLVALMPASRLDWYMLARGMIALFGSVLAGTGGIHEPWLRAALRTRIVLELVPGALFVSVGALVLLCVVGRWKETAIADPAYEHDPADAAGRRQRDSHMSAWRSMRR